MDIRCSSLAAVAPKLITAIAGYDVKNDIIINISVKNLC